mgnify:FL=1
MTPSDTIARPNFGKGQKVAYTGTAGTITNAFPEGTAAVWVSSTTSCFIRIGVSPTAVVDVDFRLPAEVPMCFPAIGGEKVSAVQDTAGGIVYAIPV